MKIVDPAGQSTVDPAEFAPEFIAVPGAIAPIITGVPIDGVDPLTRC